MPCPETRTQNFGRVKKVFDQKWGNTTQWSEFPTMQQICDAIPNMSISTVRRRVNELADVGHVKYISRRGTIRVSPAAASSAKSLTPSRGNEKMFERIKKLLEERDYLTTKIVSNRLRCSNETARRYLMSLEEEAEVRRDVTYNPHRYYRRTETPAVRGSQTLRENVTNSISDELPPEADAVVAPRKEDEKIAEILQQKVPVMTGAHAEEIKQLREEVEMLKAHIDAMSLRNKLRDEADAHRAKKASEAPPAPSVQVPKIEGFANDMCVVIYVGNIAIAGSSDMAVAWSTLQTIRTLTNNTATVSLGRPYDLSVGAK